MWQQLGVKFAPKSEEKQKQSHSVEIFIRLIEMKIKTKRFYWTILLYVVLLCGISFIVQYYVFCTIFDHLSRIKTKQIRKKGLFRLSCMMEGRLIFREVVQISMGGSVPPTI